MEKSPQTPAGYLTIPEEIFLLSLYDKEGDASLLHRKTFDLVLAGSVLMDLALRNCIDTDLKAVYPDRIEPANDFVLDEVLMDISTHRGDHQSISHWLNRVSLKADKFRDLIITRLLKKEIIRIENKKIRWFSSSLKYPVMGTREVLEIRSRMRKVVEDSAKIPEIRDIVILSLVANSDLLELVFSKEELTKHMPRINQISKMDLIGQAIAGSMKQSIVSTIESRTRELLGLKDKNPEEMLESLIEEMKMKYGITSGERLPEWLRKGTAQYQKTLDFIKARGTANIMYNSYTDTYSVKNYSTYMHVFGSGN
jgi:hypothetical protein